ncbi:MAG: hypothetical protein EOO13_00275 [Chitinophagaceae bacterium]|nr:MAG: hypothetical protein EOO13_00275 [Chitinophagaceae bacterium]
MKQLLLTLGVISLLSCNSETTKKETKTEAQKKVSKRDMSITSSNSYSDLFMDSTSMVEFFKQENIGDSLIRRMTSFYNTRNYQFAWFNSDGLTEQGRGFWNLHEYATTYANDTFMVNKELSKTMNGLLNAASLNLSASQKNILQSELKLTSHFILYALNNIDDGFIKRKEMERFVPRIKEDPLQLADSLLTKKHKDGKYYEDVNEPYKQLKLQLKKYYDVAKAGGWPMIDGTAKDFKDGATGPNILLLKKRLFLSGDMAQDSVPAFDAALIAGINNFQVRHGYSPTGKLTDAQLKDMNVSAVDRVKQILVNMGRMQWMIHQPEGQLMLVNIPEFKLHVMEGKAEAFDMDVVVGKEGNNTMIFTGNLNQVVFSPYWNVPPDIIKEEIMPAMQRNPNYLASHNMEQTGTDGGLPVVRQLPGEDNSLGKVKFLFPNSFNIYFHDTPAKTLFQKDKRAFSHGCIRLAEPAKLASYLLKGQSEWSEDKIDAAMNSGEEKYVKLQKPVPVLITYYTAWVDKNGLLHFADDIYDHDKDVAQKMFL